MLDTNTLAASIAGSTLGWQAPPAQIWRRWQRKQFDLLISEQVMSELSMTLALPWFAARVDPAARELTIGRIHTLAEMVTPVIQLTGVTSHWQDDLVLAAAVPGNAGYLVTGDARFRAVGEDGEVKLRTPAEFLRALDDQSA